MRDLFTWLVVGFMFATAPFATAAGKAKHVLVIVWDGMRPDFVTADGRPTSTGSRTKACGLTIITPSI